MSTIEIKRAILSLSDKSGASDLARYLEGKGVEIFSTGGTFKLLREKGISVKEITELTDFPEMMDGRIKTLNPKVHGGILAVRDNPEHMKQALANGVEMIDLLVVNLYPFEKTVAKPDVEPEEAIENIDIGGPAMIRSAAKNYKYVTVITDPADYAKFVEEYDRLGGTSLEFRQELARKVFAKTGKYDGAISEYLERTLAKKVKKTVVLENGRILRYGENPHQKGILFPDGVSRGTLANAEMVNGKEMSYNNYMDAQAALDTVLEFDEPAAVVIKHMNPCGAATGRNLRDAIEKAWFSDPISAMGSVVAFNREFDMDTLRFFRGDEVKHLSFTVENDKLIESEIKRKFIEVIIAPSFSAEALEYITKKKNFENVRVLKIDLDASRKAKDFNLKRIDGGYLYQTADNELFSRLDTVTKAQFGDEMKKLAEFSYKCCKHTKSNAIVLCRRTSAGYQVLGMGAGQPNRVDSLRKLAVTKARENLEYEHRTLGVTIPFEEYFRKVISEDTVLASDAFFPFDDTVRTAASYGIRFIIQPGGSQNDTDSIYACDELGIAMIFAGNRHFKH